MGTTPQHDSDPAGWCWTLSLAFLVLTAVRLTVPSTPYFDEIHYLPAARDFLAMEGYPNREHPTLGKYLIAAGIALFGDDSFGWRVFPWAAGGLALFAGMRAMWFASLSRFATIAFGVLQATGFHLFVHARIAMLDVFMVAFFAVALWQCAAAVREPEGGKVRLAVAGAALGLSMASKWNVVPLAMVPGIAFLVARFQAGRQRLFASRRGLPVPGVSLIEAALLLGLLPLTVYALTFAPMAFADGSPLPERGLVGLHLDILDLQASVTTPHPYQSTWLQWVGNARAIWYLYEVADGAQRGVLLIGNPFTMLAGLAALGWCGWAAIQRQRTDCWAVLVLYAVALGLWVVAAKPIQFYYHYFLPSCFLLAALALALDALWHHGGRLRWLAIAALAGSLAVFAHFYPILSAAELDGVQAYAKWMWLDSWR